MGFDPSAAIRPVNTNSEEEVIAATRTVCDPRNGFSAEEASEVLKALGLIDDPLHKETDMYNRRRGDRSGRSRDA